MFRSIQRAREVDPKQSRRGRALAVEFTPLRNELHFPSRAVYLRVHEWQRVLGQLQQSPITSMGRKKNFARDFRRVALAAPHGLPLLHFPTRLREIYGGQIRKGAAGRAKDRRQQQRRHHPNSRSCHSHRACVVPGVTALVLPLPFANIRNAALRLNR